MNLQMILYVLNMKSGSNLDDNHKSLKEDNLWDADVAWPSLKQSL